jgi:endonuclease YncB( thermonuclease family)
MVELIQKYKNLRFLIKKYSSIICAESYQDIKQGHVLEVIDGDGLLISHGKHILNTRFAYIDAPEYNQEYGSEAKQWLENYLSNNPSTVGIRFIGFDEKHKRNIVDIFIKGYSLSWLMAITGNAWAYYDFLTDEVEQCYLEAQYFARQYRLGIWTKNLFPTPSWIYRAEQKGKKIYIQVNPALVMLALEEATLNNSDEKNLKTIAEAKLQIEFNRSYCPMRYFHQVNLDNIKYANIVGNSEK